MTGAEIADRLTDTQKAAVLSAKPTPDGTKYWLGRTRADTHGILHGLGLVDYHAAPARLTPLGHSVRHHLTVAPSLYADAEFLCARIRELEGEMRDDDELSRQYFGHVLPAVARMESGLAEARGEQVQS